MPACRLPGQAVVAEQEADGSCPESAAEGLVALQVPRQQRRALYACKPLLGVATDLGCSVDNLDTDIILGSRHQCEVESGQLLPDSPRPCNADPSTELAMNPTITC